MSLFSCLRQMWVGILDPINYQKNRYRQDNPELRKYVYETIGVKLIIRYDRNIPLTVSTTIVDEAVRKLRRELFDLDITPLLVIKMRIYEGGLIAIKFHDRFRDYEDTIAVKLEHVPRHGSFSLNGILNLAFGTLVSNLSQHNHASKPNLYSQE